MRSAVRCQPGSLGILGVGEADGGRATGRSGLELAAEAALRATEDAGIALDDIDALLVESPDVEQHHMAHLALADALGVRPGYALSTGCGGATPFANVILASALVAQGLAETILIVDYDARQTNRSADPRERLRRGAGHRNPWEDPYGPITAAKFALVAQAHMDRFGTTREQLAQVTVSARRNGALRANAQLQRPVTTEEVLASPPIAEPLHRLDCCVVSDWGSALVVGPADAGAARAVPLLGHGQAHDGYAISRARDLTEGAAIRRSGAQALSSAALTVDDVDVALIYDSFTITALLALEALGFCERGEGGPFVSSGAIETGGRFPVNPHGGQLSYSGGHGHFIAEAVRQLRGEAPSAQVPGARVALCQGTAAGVLSSYTLLLGAPA
jgi:acetyl-CoA acetyltransferase